MTALSRGNDQHVAERLEFMDLDASARASLQKLKPLIAKSIGPALDAFYAKARANPATSKFFSGESHVASAKNRQEKHWNVIADAQFGSAYADAVTTIGNTHARLGLEPRWYIGGYALIAEKLLGALIADQWPRFGARNGGHTAMAASVSSLMKAVLLDMDLAISTYLLALEQEKAKADAEKQEAKDRQDNALQAIRLALSTLAKGDLRARIDTPLGDEFETLRADFNLMANGLETAIANVSQVSNSIGGSCDEIGQASDDLSRRTEQQAASLEETAAAVEELTASVKRSSEGANAAAEKVVAARQDADRSGKIMTDAVAAMASIEKSAHEISQIIGVIDEIAFQTNLLALNAGVEAARAGEAGRGFAVVAQEVRALAQRSAEAAKEIKSLIQNSTTHVENGVKLMDQTGKVSERIISQVIEIDQLVAGMASSSREQSTGLAEINTAISHMDQATQQNAAMVEETTAAVHSLRNEAGELVRAIASFSVSGQARPAPARAPSSAARPASRPKAAAAAPVRGNTALKPAAEQDGWEEF
ncbi:globin-coupled sensor protein [Aquibium oceanicum]|uniref:Globin-coupled sensor protein n=1 Tax=Aquibium oceanicum TaxID=1670800 RepID=A0A1L3SW44_9HYPH|nr:globin-coupled sensor protein [Aquibium oceanicum]APH73564.1 globin-coupled sensor protein [Aquibium oceanicum]